MKRLVHAYAKLLATHPSVVLLFSGSISCILTGISVYHFLINRPSFHPKLGFESRGTEYSGRILAWELLEDMSVWQNTRQITKEKPYARRGKRQVSSSSTSSSNPLSIFANRNSNSPIRASARPPPTTTTTTIKPPNAAWAEAFVSAVAAVPCQQMRSPANSEEMKKIMPYLSQVVYEAANLDELFSIDAMSELCNLHQVSHEFRLRNEHRLKDAADLIHIFSLANYAVCGDGNSFPQNCSKLTQEHVTSFRRQLERCAKYREDLEKCRLDEFAEICFTIPEECQSEIVTETFYRAISRDAFTNPQEKVYVAVALPIPQRYAHYFRYSEFEKLRDAVTDYSSNLTKLKLVGMEFDTKLSDFYAALENDLYFGGVSLLLIILVIFVYSRSILYMTAVALCVIFSLTNAYFCYTYIFGVTFFPFMNLLVFVLLVGIGADDTFVLKHIFDESVMCGADPRSYSVAAARIQPQSLATDMPIIVPHVENGGHPTTKAKKVDANHTNVHMDKPKQSTPPLVAAVERTLTHACVSMFVTSATTAVAFYANVVNNVMCIRCFGIFAGSTMVVNYLLVVTWLPAALILIHKHCNYQWPNWCTCQQMHQKISDYVTNVIQYLVINLYLLWLTLGIALFSASILSIFVWPRLQLPDRNPLQVFGNSHPYEWYADQAQLLFPYAGIRNEEPIYVDITWGFAQETGAPNLDPKDKGRLVKNGFNITSVAQLRALTDLQLRLSQMPSLGTAVDQSMSTKFLPKFQAWSRTKSRRCSTQRSCCNISDVLFSGSNLPKCINKASRLSGMVDYAKDTPVIVKNETHNTLHVIGYTTRLSTNLTYSPVYTKLHKLITSVEADMDSVMKQFALDYRNSSEVYVEPLVHAWALPVAFDVVLVARWYSLLHAVLTDTPISIGISVLVAALVVVLVTRQPCLAALCLLSITATISTTIGTIAMLGWRIALVESTIIILTVGLSFDFTLHMAVSYRQCRAVESRKNDGNSASTSIESRISRTVNHIGHPVLLSTITTVLAGGAMTFSTTLAFYQIGMFMIFVTLSSYFYAQFVFCSALILLHPIIRRVDCW